ncbi:MAG: ubiquinone/menaquinone biosynthesis methyltransferase [Anaerolineae bacterium]|nr:ubiquinone/menaquinone biosynthesis methyltransferase [Anaerolineae bacterium]
MHFIKRSTQPLSAQEEKEQRAAMQELFTRIASQYDLVNWLISWGQVKRWRQIALELAAVPATGRLLDVGTGTGEFALAAHEHFSTARVVGVDITLAMLAQAKRKPAQQRVAWNAGDALHLPYPDNTFDAVISAFIMRNVPDVGQAFAEQTRVVRPGGKIICLEMSWPRQWFSSLAISGYFFVLAPLVGSLFSGETAAYQYLPHSVKAFMRPESVSALMAAQCLHALTCQQRMWGTVAIYSGKKVSSQ